MIRRKLYNIVMKILVLNGSPKQKSDTMRLTNAFLDGIRKTGDHEIEVIDVIKKDIKPCVGCYICWKKQNGRCAIDDYQNVILDKMREADTIIWSFPMYCCGMPSHLKAVLDRTIPLSRMVGKQDDGKIGHESNSDFSKKRYIVICGSGFPTGTAKYDAIKIQCMHMFGRVRMIFVSQTPLLNLTIAPEAVNKLLAKFTAAGEEFGTRTYLYRNTVAALEEPMLPNDEYVKLANAQYEVSRLDN